MKPTLKQATWTVALAGGFLICGGQAALADDGIASHASSTVQVSNVSPSTGLTVCGNSVAVLDAETEAECEGAQSTSSGGDANAQQGDRAGDRDGIASDSGSTVQAGNLSPTSGVTVCGNSVAVLDAGTEADCNGEQSSDSGGQADAQQGDRSGDRDGIASDSRSTVQAGNVSPSAGLTVCGNSASVGDASSSAGCDGRRTTTSGGDARRESEKVAGARPEMPGQVGETPEQADAREQAQPGERPGRGATRALGERGRPAEVLGLTLARPASEEVAPGRIASAAPVTMLAERSPTGHLPLTGGLIPGLGWAVLFVVAGTGFLITDALTS